ncbi:MAG: hypothetical protein ACW98X_27100 [Promethearchaeota archaeon]
MNITGPARKRGRIIIKTTITSGRGHTHEGKGKGIYYWPDSRKMMDIQSKIKDEGKSAVIYYDKDGGTYSNEDLPAELKEKHFFPLQIKL